MKPDERYFPRMSNHEVEKRRVWQEKVYNSLKKINKEQKVKVLGKQIIVVPGIFAPIFGDSTELAKVVRKKITRGSFVLDLGTGTGIQAIFAAEKASKVTAVDMNPKAIICAKKNIKQFELEKKVEIKKSNLFSNLKKQKFDFIIFNPPFRWFKPRDSLETGELDENYETLRRFFKEVKSHLKSKSKILLVFSNSGDLKYLKELIKKSKLKYKTLAKKKEKDWRYYVVFRISRQFKE